MNRISQLLPFTALLPTILPLPSYKLRMLPARRDLLVTGIVVICIALGLLVSTLIICLVQQLNKQLRRRREATLFRNNSTSRLSLST
jgi:hypothetical protein